MPIGQGGLTGANQSPQTSAPRPADPILKDPILVRNCQAEYEQALKSLGGSGGQMNTNMSGTPKQVAELGSATDKALSESQSIHADMRRDEILWRKIECKTDQENRKLDYLLNINGAHR
jgi:hypothetical protein